MNPFERNKKIMETIAILRTEMPKVFKNYCEDVQFGHVTDRFKINLDKKELPVLIIWESTGFFEKALRIEVDVDTKISFAIVGILKKAWIDANIQTPIDYYLTFETVPMRLGGDWQ